MLYCAVAVRLVVTPVNDLSQPVKAYPTLPGTVGATASLPFSTVWVSSTVSFQSLNVTVYVICLTGSEVLLLTVPVYEPNPVAITFTYLLASSSVSVYVLAVAP